MKKMLIATTALTSFAVAAPALAADVTISGGVEWRYISVGDDLDNETARASDTDFQGSNDVIISITTTSDSGLTFGLTINIGDQSVGTTTSSIKGDFGTIEFIEGDGGAHAASAYDVSSPGISGGHGDPGFGLFKSDGTAVSSVGLDEAQINDPENGVLNYHSPTFSGFSFGVGTSHLGHGDEESSTSYGAKFSGDMGMMDDGMMGGLSYSVGIAGYDGGDNVGGSHVGFNITSGALTFGLAQASNEKAEGDEEEITSYSFNYSVSDSLTLNAGHAVAENDLDDAEATNTTLGIQYVITPGMTFSLSSHNFEYTEATEANNNEGSAIQSELKMSF